METFLIYIDDSGDTGFKSQGSNTDAFILSALIIRTSDWLNALNAFKGFRTDLFDTFGIRTRAEIKAQYLLHGTGPFRGTGVGFDDRMRIYRNALRLIRDLNTFRTWAIVITKDAWEKRGWAHIPLRQVAWENMIQRLERFTNYGQANCLVFPDEGNPKFVRSMFRKMRRFSLVPSAYHPRQRLPRNATFIIEDPSFRSSIDSYFIQFADLISYAAYRRIFPKAIFGPDFWEELGDSRVKEVNAIRLLRRDLPLGVVVRP